MYHTKAGFAAAGYAAAAAQAGYNFYRAYDNTTRSHAFALRGRTVTLPRRKKKQQYGSMTAPYRRVSRRAGRYKKKTAKAAHRRLDKDQVDNILRWQNVSRFGVGPGIQGLYTYKGPAPAELVIQPMHVMDLTALRSNPAVGPLGRGMYAVETDNTGALTYTLLKSQDSMGTTLAVGQEIQEYGPVLSTDYARLKWCDIRMNLYGAYYVPVKYKISIIKIHDEKAVFGTNAPQDREKVMVDSMLKTMKYSNLLCNSGYQKKSYRVIKQFNYTIEPLMKSDAEVVNEGDQFIAPNMTEFKFFYKMDRDCIYNWHDSASLSNLRDDTANVNTMQTTFADCHDTVYPASRVYLVVQASSTYQDTSNNPETQLMTVPVAKWAGSYDIVVRRKFQIPSA